MSNKIRQSAAIELKDPDLIISANPTGWAAVRAALISAEAQVRAGADDLLAVARRAIQDVHDSGFESETTRMVTRFTGFKYIMAWQDALYSVNELEDWHFSDEVLRVGWLVELGGPELSRGPAIASYWQLPASHYIGGSRDLYNRGAHGNGPGWPTSLQYRGKLTR